MSDTSRSQVNDHDDVLDFVVHNFNLETTRTSTLLDVGHSLIRAATSPRGWISVGGNSSENPSTSSRRSFQYIGSIVQISVKGHPRILKEWGEPIGPDDDDVYNLEDLGEFESTDLSSLWLGNSPSDKSNRTRSCSFADIEGPPLKRRKLDLYPLHDLIPQPHVHPSSQRSSSSPLDVPRYISKKLIAIPPHVLPFSPSHFARTAWLIPIRGSFPWEGSTSAAILDASFSMPIPPNPNTGDPIMWTHASLASFWSYLIHLQNSRCVGTIGLSFHASNSTSPFMSSNPRLTSRNNTLSLMSGIGNQAGLESHITSEQRSIITPSPPSPAALSSVDHIKVYHEASNAMQVRGALFAWSYPPLSPEQKDANSSQSVRVLKGAGLVLIDERSHGVLIA